MKFTEPSSHQPGGPEAPANSKSDSEVLISRNQLAKRWGVSKETIKRRERDGLLQPIRFSQRLLRYRVEDIEKIERQMSC